MTNAEKFYEVFGTKGWVDWDAEYKGEPTIPLSVIEKIKAEIAEREACLSVGEGLMPYEITEIIDKAVKECTHE